MIAVRSALLTLLAIGIAGCSDPPTGPPKRLEGLPRALTTGERKIIAAGNTFSLALFRQINGAQRDSNVFLSPLSASMSLGMTLNGAANATYDSMRAALGFGDATQAEINEGYRSLIALLRGLDPATDFRIVNSIWSRSGFPFEPSFFDAGTTFFDAEVRSLDFGDPASLATINDWVNRATAQKIPTILDAISDRDVMFLINAIYFKGTWQYMFDRAETKDAPFTSLAGTVRPVPLMHQQATLRYVGDPRFQAVDLLYGNGAFAMTVILPASGQDVNALAGSLSEAEWARLLAGFRDEAVDLSLPKFKLEYQRMMNDDLAALGMGIAFADGVADFTRMSPAGRELFISFVKQKTYVDVYEDGTEAAAVTVTGMGTTSVGPGPVTMRVDRPFIFAIRERFSNTILFVGKIETLE